ncbi:hypothetical protein EV368DRAFT_68311 [Lentinula lateritia]|nr:hypothetical protein EV368DRAFT_68311 [Lentinula lateritia]
MCHRVPGCESTVLAQCGRPTTTHMHQEIGCTYWRCGGGIGWITVVEVYKQEVYQQINRDLWAGNSVLVTGLALNSMASIRWCLLIKPTATASNLADYALEYGYTKKLQGSDDMIFRVGIDVLFRHINSSTVLLQLFQFLCQLCHVPVADFVFMYDPVLGVDLEADSLEYEQSKQLVQSFNYHIDVAKRVVNAELSAMNKLGVIDAVLTNDSHVFPFGVKCVLDNWVYSTKSTPTNLAIDIYCAEIIDQQLGIQEDGFILLALLLGSDFNEGVHGVGMKTAVALARHGFGKTLLHNYHQFLQVPELLNNFFIQLNHEIADEIELNTSKNLHRQSPRRTHEFLDADFPSVDALEGLKIFTELVTHPSPLTPSCPLTPKWPYNVPHISNIAAFCTTHLCWSTEFMYQEFHAKLYRGVIIRDA